MKRIKTLLTLLMFGIAVSMDSAHAANLKPETVAAWNAYVDAARTRLQTRVSSDRPFLASDETAGQAARLRSGEIVVSPASANIPRHVPSGLIHDWIGAAFIPNATMAEALAVLRDYRRYREIYRPAVIDSKAFEVNESEDRFSVVLMNRSVISKTALDTNYRAVYTKLDDHRWYSVAETAGIQEIADYGTAAQHALPKDQGTGLIWRMVNIARFEERDGGVYVEIEAIVLSRDVPVTLRWMVDPIIRRVSRESLTTSMQQTQDAVQPRTSNTIISMSPATSASGSGQVAAHSFR